VTTRKITFPTVGIVQGSRVWRNHETGVEIVETGADYRVQFPTQDSTGRAVMTTTPTLADAEIMGGIAARRVRRDVAAAHAEAVAR
jgi:hypothetical protein